jgi:hypothetical protein
VCRWSVHPSRDQTVSAGDQDALYGGNWLSCPGQPSDASYDSAPLLDLEFLDRTDALCVQPFKELSRLRMQHAASLVSAYKICQLVRYMAASAR